MSNANTEPARASLVGLPLELRLHIFEWLLQDEKRQLRWPEVLVPNVLQRRFQSKRPQLILTCHQLKDELDEHEATLQVQISTLQCFNIKNLQKVADEADTRMLHLIRSIDVASVSPGTLGHPLKQEGVERLQCLAAFPQLNHLCLRVGSINRLGGERKEAWLDTDTGVRDQRYRKAIGKVMDALPALRRGLELEVLCSIGAQMSKPWRIPIRVTLLVECRGGAGWKQVSIRERKYEIVGRAGLTTRDVVFDNTRDWA